MRAVLQRVSEARVRVDDAVVGAIGPGLVVLLGVANGDGEADMEQLAAKIVGLRIFENEDGKFDRSLLDVGGGALVVSQFTLLANTQKGRRPSFTDAADPGLAKNLYQRFAARLTELGVNPVATGTFGAHMHVELINDGPVTLLLESSR